MQSLRNLINSFSASDSKKDDLPYDVFKDQKNDGIVELVMDKGSNAYPGVVQVIQGLGFSESKEGCDNPVSIDHIDCYEGYKDCDDDGGELLSRDVNGVHADDDCGVQTTPLDLYSCSNSAINVGNSTEIFNRLNNQCADPGRSDKLTSAQLGIILGSVFGGALVIIFLCLLCNRMRGNRNARQSEERQSILRSHPESQLTPRLAPDATGYNSTSESVVNDVESSVKPNNGRRLN